MDGLELCRRVRGHEDSGYTYFILLTANVGDREYTQAMDAGIDDFLPKPVDSFLLSMRLRVAERILTTKLRVEHLETLLPICSYCKKIRKQDQSWTSVESYLRSRMKTDVSHGVCPECMKRHVDPQFESTDS